MQPTPPAHRYERLCAANDTELAVVLHALPLTHAQLGLPEPPAPDALADDFDAQNDPFAPLVPLPPRASPDDGTPTATGAEDVDRLYAAAADADDDEFERDILASIARTALRNMPPAAAPQPNEPGLQPPHPARQSQVPQPPAARSAHPAPHHVPPHHHRQLHRPRVPTPHPFAPPAPPHHEPEPPQPDSGADRPPGPPGFRTARSQLARGRGRGRGRGTSYSGRGSGVAGGTAPSDRDNSLGARRAPVAARAVLGAKRGRTDGASAAGGSGEGGDSELPEIPNVDPKLVEQILNETLDRSPGVEWDDIAGLVFAKRCVMEAVVWPMRRPDIFTGLRGPPKGLLLFGPPGTGKTMIGKAIASQSGARFFNISASSLVSKWAGEGEKTVRALFAVARIYQPSVVFIDEIDSLLTQRSDGEQEHSRRIKTEFLVQMDGAGTSRDDRVLVVGATNRPQELDEAARRRLVKRLYIPLPDAEARAALVEKLLQREPRHGLSGDDLHAVARLSDGYSGSDIFALCSEAALGPVRQLGDSIGSVTVADVRAVALPDFKVAARMVRASVSKADLEGYLEWNAAFGSFPADPATGGVSGGKGDGKEGGDKGSQK